MMAISIFAHEGESLDPPASSWGEAYERADAQKRNPTLRPAWARGNTGSAAPKNEDK